MKQIHLFCPHCRKRLDFADYRLHLEDPKTRATCCFFCGRFILTSDVDEPRLLQSLIARVKFKEKILQLCALTGMSVGEMEKYVEDNNLTLPGMDNLIDSIIQGRKGKGGNLSSS